MKIAQALIFCIIVIVILAGLTACEVVETKAVTVSGSTTTVTTTILGLDIPTYNQFWGEISTSVSEEFAIVLNQSPRLGLGWYATYDENLLVLLAKDFIEYSTPGAVAGDQYSIFKALKMGTTEITFIYKHSAPEADILNEKTFTVEIQ
jgi:predicted secreted protein